MSALTYTYKRTKGTYASDGVDNGHYHRDDGRDDGLDATSNSRDDGALENDRTVISNYTHVDRARRTHHD
jgi:hypothetical protein